MDKTKIETLETIRSDAPENQNRILMEVFSLQQTEHVLSNVERVQLKLIPKKFDTSRLRTALAEFKEDSESSDQNAIELRLLQELQMWRLALAQRDARITAFQLRRFCEEAEGALNQQTIAALACFYRNLMPSFETRSKFDYAVTQMFTVVTGKNRKRARASGDKLTEHLRQLNLTWTGSANEPKNNDDRKRREDAVITFESLAAEITAYSKLEILLKGEFFKRLRRHKQYIGDAFFAPEVTAASIICNVAVGNKFNELIAAENDSLQNVLESEFNGLDLWKDALEDNPNRSQQILQHLVPDFSAQNSHAPGGKVANSEMPITKNMSHNRASQNDSATNGNYGAMQTFDSNDRKDSSNELTTPKATEMPQPNANDKILAAEKKSAPINNNQENAHSQSAFSSIIEELAKPYPNKKALSAYLKASPSAELHNFDFSTFYPEIDEFQSKAEELALRRKALRLIFQAEDLCRRKRGAIQDAPENIEIENLIEEMQLLGNSLRLAISEVTGEFKKERSNALLTASNHLLEARLRLSSLNAKTTTPILALPTFVSNSKPEKREPQRTKEIVENEPAQEVEVNSKDDELIQNVDRKKFNLLKVDKKYLLILIAVVVLAIGVLVVDPFGDSVATGVSSSVAVVDLQKLKAGNHLEFASVNANEFFGIVKNEWNSLPEEQKREIIKKLLEERGAHNFASLTLLDSKGRIVGRGSENEIIIN